MSNDVRIPLVEPGTRPELAEVEHLIVAERGAVSDLYRSLLNSAPLAEGWEKLLTAIRNRSTLPPDLRELVILRVAVLNRAPFEFEAHRPHAARAGVGEDKLAALSAERLAGPFTPEERAVLALVDAMTRDIQVPDDVFAAATRSLDARAATELVATIAAYNMVSRYLEAMRIGH
jgi:4-carboxymuconolactone decarboxylase